MSKEAERALASTLCEVTTNGGKILGLGPSEATAALATALATFAASHAHKGQEVQAVKLVAKLVEGYAVAIDQIVKAMQADTSRPPN